MENWNIETFLKTTFDFKAAGRTDVLEINSAICGCDPHYRFNDFVDVLCIETNGHTVDRTEVLKQQGFALHHRQRCNRSDIAQSEHGRTVSDDQDGIGFPRVRPPKFWMIGDCLRDPPDTGGVCNS